MLDTATLRVAFGIVALAVLLLFYVATYRPTHSAYSGWWCVSLSLFVVGASLYLLDGTPGQVVANPTGNALTVAGSAAVWAGTRALAGLPVLRGWMVAGPVVVLAVSLLDDPADDVWTGGPFFLATMAIYLGAASFELRLVATRDGVRRRVDRSVRGAVAAMALMSLVLSVFYALRSVALAVVGPDHVLFAAVLGSQTTTLLTLVMLVVVTYTMSILGHEQQTDVLRTIADHDDLTGLLNRGAFFARLEGVLADPGAAAACAVVVADLDGFKGVNDRDGHGAGDRALTAFAAAVRRALHEGDSAARLGGDEFAVLLRDGDLAAGFARLAAEAMRREVGDDGPTVSIGMARGWAGADPDQLVDRADVALYRAKAAGRDRAVSWDAAEADPTRSRVTRARPGGRHARP